MRTSVSAYHRHRFRAETISHSVWLYFRFALSFRDVEEMHGVQSSKLRKSYATIFPQFTKAIDRWMYNPLEKKKLPG